jgi:hypothetical protein
MITPKVSLQSELLPQHQQPQQARKAICIKRSVIGCALIAILAGTQYLINTQTSRIDCVGTSDYYRVASWWSASANYCLAEEQLKLANAASPEKYEEARELLVESAKWGLHAAITKLSDCSLYPTIPSTAEIDLIKRVAFPDNRAAVLPWSFEIHERCF